MESAVIVRVRWRFDKNDIVIINHLKNHGTGQIFIEFAGQNAFNVEIDVAWIIEITREKFGLTV